ncbi:acyl carrier protein [Microbispora sp. RL4-1S]|uniref:Acyl carrier protein n=1 Tax=Microbispora oryzae TaxID=2806554 RepID=A0A940WJ31_9ACTN|nr:phosphopantetheine-binding protein [Microbispora oryzae]MBP2703743.1 acyl carrier protein [Microbispora oryzae]
MSQEAVESTIQEFIKKELLDLGVEEDSITADARFDELDIDSLDVADLMTSIKRDYGVEIPRRDLVGITLGQLAERVVRERPAASA